VASAFRWPNYNSNVYTIGKMKPHEQSSGLSRRRRRRGRGGRIGPRVGSTPPAACDKDGLSPAKTKRELLIYLRDSFAAARQPACPAGAPQQLLTMA